MADNIVRQNTDIPWADFRDIELAGGIFEALEIDGQHFIAVPSMADAELVRPNQAARDLNRLMGKDFQSSIQKVRTTRNPKALNAISIDNFYEVLKKLVLRGNEKALDLLLADSKAMTEARIKKAFGTEVTIEETLELAANYFEQAQIAQRCMKSSDPVVQHLAQFVADNPDFEVENYGLP